MAATFQYAPLPLDQESFTIMLVGPPGTGKTMTVAKMASQAVMDKKKPIVITTDNKRAGGVEQLSAFTAILGIELHVADNRGELWRLLQEYPPHEHRILIDTGGVNPFNPADLRELSRIYQARPQHRTGAGIRRRFRQCRGRGYGPRLRAAGRAPAAASPASTRPAVTEAC